MGEQESRRPELEHARIYEDFAIFTHEFYFLVHPLMIEGR